MKYLLLFIGLLLSSCAATTRISPIDAYINFDNAPTYYKANANGPTTYTFHQNDIIHVVKRRDDWLIFLLEGKEIYINSYYVNTQQATSASGSRSSNMYQGQPSYRSSGSHDIQTGPRGGRYYINSNGNKTYVKHK